MFFNYFILEANFYFPRKWFLALLLLFTAFGGLLSVITSFSFTGVFSNSPFVLTYTLGLVSLLNIFTIVILSSQIFLREIDTRFSAIIYATPLNKNTYLLSRFTLILLITALSFLLFIIGLMIGHLIQGDQQEKLMSVHLINYLQPYILLVLPNIFFCTAVISAVALISQSKMIVFLSGIFIYVLYFVVSLFSNSPLFANASPVSSDTMASMATVDPFGFSAFFEQCQSWDPDQKNTKLLQLTGHLLTNRIGILIFSVAVIAYAIYTFRFKNHKSQKVQPYGREISRKPNPVYNKINISNNNFAYKFRTLLSFLKIDLQSMLKGLPFVIIIVLWVFFLGMEIFSDVDAGMRLPQRYASSGLMVRNIMNSFPFFAISVLLFYGMEAVWRSRNSRIDMLENCTPMQAAVHLLAKWISLSCVALFLITVSIVLCIALQLTFQYPIIEWNLYLSLFYILGVPALLYSALIVSLQTMIKVRYPALIFTVLFFILTNSSIGTMVGIQHPLLRFAKSPLQYSGDINQFGSYLNVFGIKMIYWISFTVLITIASTWSWQNITRISGRIRGSKRITTISLLMFMTLLLSGYHIYRQTHLKSSSAEIEWRQHYEEKYRHYQHIPQPTIVSVTTEIDLYPKSNQYAITGQYLLVNKSTSTLDSILLYHDPSMELVQIRIDHTKQIAEDNDYGHRRFKLTTPLMPGDSIRMEFAMKYSWNAFNRHDPLNAIIANGSFMRISRYYPIFGYQSQNEIEDPIERAKRKLGIATPLKKLEQRDPSPYNYGYIDLETIISSDSDQTCIATGDFIQKWKKNNRNFFRYKSAMPIPFRFGVSSANYVLESSSYEDISIEIYYDRKHPENVRQLLDETKKTLAYCENNFGKYPFKSIRFVEISGFTSGFNATAYPGTIFMNENMTFHSDLRREKTRDVINELAGHELSHQWWGNSQIDPDDKREGAAILTETLAMYTELMLYKHKHGSQAMKHMIKMYQDLYEIGKANSKDEALSRVSPGNTNVSYYKGLLAMYQLHELIGEEKINKALKVFLNRYAFPHQPPTSTDLIREFLKVSNPVLQDRIHKLFM